MIPRERSTEIKVNPEMSVSMKFLSEFKLLSLFTVGWFINYMTRQKVWSKLFFANIWILIFGQSFLYYYKDFWNNCLLCFFVFLLLFS